VEAGSLLLRKVVEAFHL
jgi:hypothetical protein